VRLLDAERMNRVVAVDALRRRDVGGFGWDYRSGVGEEALARTGPQPLTSESSFATSDRSGKNANTTTIVSRQFDGCGTFLASAGQ
jgi:hypothetical protein